jgi:2-C-methyl-D-erythritol 4-phosphate cytidylyltransferase
VLTTVILVAAGPGTRLGAAGPKAFVTIGGIPLFIHAARAMLAAEGVSALVVAAPPRELERTSAILEQYGPWSCPVDVVAGGAERQHSVRAGLSCADATDLIAIHDAARPFVDPAVVSEAIRSADRHGAALVAMPAVDTVKRGDEKGFVTETLPREQLWLAQTPQVFRADVIRAAHARAEASGTIATDDAALVEQIGVRVHIVRGSADNRKITTAEDLRWAEWRWTQTGGLR